MEASLIPCGSFGSKTSPVKSRGLFCPHWQYSGSASPPSLRRSGMTSRTSYMFLATQSFSLEGSLCSEAQGLFTKGYTSSFQSFTTFLVVFWFVGKGYKARVFPSAYYTLLGPRREQLYPLVQVPGGGWSCSALP